MQSYLLITLIAVIFLCERFFAYRISLGFRKDIDSLREQMSALVNEFSKLAGLVQAFLMNVHFKQETKSFSAVRKQTAQETQDEFPELLTVEQWKERWQEADDG